jgi:hypothetical protein
MFSSIFTTALISVANHLDRFIKPMSTLFPFLMPLIVLIILIGTFSAYRFSSEQQTISIGQSLKRFRISLICLAIGLGIAAIAIQILMSNLSDLGYSDISEDVQTVEQIINYLQQQQRAIAINTYSLLWFFYIFVVWFMTTLYVFCQSIAAALKRLETLDSGVD